jgi:hypothetical protein
MNEIKRSAPFPSHLAPRKVPEGRPMLPTVVARKIDATLPREVTYGPTRIASGAEFGKMRAKGEHGTDSRLPSPTRADKAQRVALAAWMVAIRDMKL